MRFLGDFGVKKRFIILAEKENTSFKWFKEILGFAKKGWDLETNNHLISSTDMQECEQPGLDGWQMCWINKNKLSGTEYNKREIL